MSDLMVCTTRFHDAQLRDATEKINRYAGEILRNGFAIGAIMAMVDTTKCYENDGFTSCVEWAMKSFGLKKSAVYNYLKIGKDFTREIVSNKGKTTGYCSNLLKIPGTDVETMSYNTEPAPAPEKDFTPSQIERLLPVGRDTAVELVREGTVTPEMSCKDIQRIVKTYQNGGDTPAEPGTDESNEKDSTPQPRKRNLKKVETAELIAELVARGFYVYENRDGAVVCIAEPEKTPEPDPATNATEGEKEGV